MDSVDEHIRSVEQGTHQRERRPIPLGTSGALMDPLIGRDHQHSGQIASRNLPIQQARNNDTRSARNLGRNTRLDSKNNSPLDNNTRSPHPGRDTLPKIRSPTSHRQGRGSAAENLRQHTAVLSDSGQNMLSRVGYRHSGTCTEPSQTATSADDYMDLDIAGASENQPSTSVFDSSMDVDPEVTDNFVRRGATPMDDLPVVEPGATFPGDKTSNNHITVVVPGITASVDGSSSEQDWELEYTSDEIGSSIIPLSSKSSAASSNQQRSVSVASCDKVNGSSTIIPPPNSGILQHDNQQNGRNISTVGCDRPNNSSENGPPLRLAHSSVQEDDLESMISLGEEDS